MSVQKSIFTCDTDCIIMKRDCIKLDYEDENISYIENEINSMMQKNVDGIDLCIEDFKTVLDKSYKMTYMSHSVFCHNNTTKKEMFDAINLIVRDVILFSSKKRLVNYLMHIEMHEKCDFDIVKFFMESLYDESDDDSIVLVGFSESKPIESSTTNKVYFDGDKNPSMILKICMGSK